MQAASCESTAVSDQPDADALARFLDGKHAKLRQRVRSLLCDPVFEPEYDIDRIRYRERVYQRCLVLARAGLGAETDAGGAEGDGLPALMAVFETLGCSDPSLVIKFGLQFILFGGAIRNLGTAIHHTRYLDKLATMELVGCFAMTEIGHGSNTRQLQTIADYDSGADEFVLHTPCPSARKQFIGNAASHARVAVVFAQLRVGSAAPGVFGFIVPIREFDGSLCKGVSIGDTGPKVGLLGVDNGWMAFERVRIPRENLLNRFGDVTPDGSYVGFDTDPTDSLLRSMSAGRLGVALVALSAARTGLVIAVRHALKRRQFGTGAGTLLLDHPLHQRRLLPRLAEAYAVDAALKAAFHNPAPRKACPDVDFEAQAAALKAHATWVAASTLQACREACGGQGYLAVNRIGGLRADIDALTTLEGDNTLLYLLAGKSLVRMRRARDAALGSSLVTELDDQWSRRVSLDWKFRWARLAATGCAADLTKLVAMREEVLLREAASPPENSKDGRPLDLQSPLFLLAEAHAERISCEQMCQRAAAAASNLRGVLHDICDLYVTGVVLRHMAWFLGERLLGGRWVKQLEEHAWRLCVRLRPHAALLVDGFAIPDACLAAPVARNDFSSDLEV